MILVWKRERNIIGRLLVKGSIILNFFLLSGMGAGSGQLVGACDSGNESSGSLKCGK